MYFKKFLAMYQNTTLEKTVEEVIKEYLQQQKQSPFLQITAAVSAPVLFSFVWWILKTAQQKQLRRIYFLARDGYLLHQYALRICEAYQIPIECRYLYSSRISWRIPSFHLIGEEAFQMIFTGGYYITPEVILKRICLSKKEREWVYGLIGLAPERWNQRLPKKEYLEFARMIWENFDFRTLLEQKSKNAYQNTIGYLEQEGLLDGDPVVIADTGWTGSMQRTLRQLLESANVTSPIVGFYFGMFESPKDPRDGTYFTWYFSKQSSISDRIKFNNNLLECICIAPHPMTIAYQRQHDHYLPVWKEDNATNLTQSDFTLQYQIHISFLKKLLQESSLQDFQQQPLHDMSKRLLQKMMYHPSQEEALAYESCYFCDDVAESYRNPVVQRVTQQQIKQYQFFRRLLQKFILKTSEDTPDLFWSYGTIALSDIRWKSWYRFQLYLWDWVRMLKMK